MPGDNILLEIRADIKDVKAKLKQVDSDFKGASKNVEAQTQRMNSGFSNLKRMIAGAFTVAILYKFQQGLKDCVKAALEQETATMSLRSIMTNLKLATDDEIDSLIKYSEQLQKTTTFGDEQTQAAMAMLGTFRLNADQMRIAIPRLMDMSAAISMMEGREVKLVESAKLFGKALIGQVGQLSRYGVVVDKAAIESDRFGGIVKSLDDNFKGQAKTLAETKQGGLTQFGNAMGDLKEAIGDAFIPALLSIADALKPIIEGFDKTIGRIDEVTNAFIKLDEAQKGINAPTMLIFLKERIAGLKEERDALESQTDRLGMNKIKIDELQSSIETLQGQYDKLKAAGKDIKYAPTDKEIEKIKETKEAVEKVAPPFDYWVEITEQLHTANEAIILDLMEINPEIKTQSDLLKDLTLSQDLAAESAEDWINSYQDAKKVNEQIKQQTANMQLATEAGQIMGNVLADVFSDSADKAYNLGDAIQDILLALAQFAAMSYLPAPFGGIVSGFAGGFLGAPAPGPVQQPAYSQQAITIGQIKEAQTLSKPLYGRRFLEESAMQNLNIESISTWEL